MESGSGAVFGGEWFPEGDLFPTNPRGAVAESQRLLFFWACFREVGVWCGALQGEKTNFFSREKKFFLSPRTPLFFSRKAEYWDK